MAYAKQGGFQNYQIDDVHSLYYSKKHRL